MGGVTHVHVSTQRSLPQLLPPVCIFPPPQFGEATVTWEKQATSVPVQGLEANHVQLMLETRHWAVWSLPQSPEHCVVWPQAVLPHCLGHPARGDFTASILPTALAPEW